MCTTLRNYVVAVLSLLLGYFLQQQRTMEEKLSSVINLLEQASDGYDYNSPTQFNPEVSRKQVKDDLCEIAYYLTETVNSKTLVHKNFLCRSRELVTIVEFYFSNVHLNLLNCSN